MPNHWTKITDASTADPRDDVYEDDGGSLFVLGQAPGNMSKAEIAAKYGVAEGDVTFPLRKK